MKPGIPWSVKGIGPEVREVAKHAARRSGMTLGEWLNSVILDQSEENEPSRSALDTVPHKDFSEARRSEAAPSRQPRQDDTTIRLEDIAQQLSRLARRDQESAAIRPYEAPSQYQDTETLQRILARVDGNEVELLRAYGDYMACPVPAGQHLVEFSFEPQSWRLGLALSAAALLLLLLWLALALRSPWINTTARRAP